MGRLLGQVRVVEVKIADQGAVGEGGQIREGRVGRAPQRRAVGDRDRLRDPAGDHARFSRPRAEGAGEAVQDSALDFVNDLSRQVFVTERLRVGGEAISNHRGFPSQTERAQRKLYHTTDGRRTAILLWYLDTDRSVSSPSMTAKSCTL